MGVVKLNSAMEIDGAKPVPLKNIMGTGLKDIDVNTLTKTGIHYCTTGVTNCPVSTYVMIIVLNNSDGGSWDLVQIAIPVGGSGVIYYRRATPGWNNWETFLTDDAKTWEYQNTNIKLGSIKFIKVGKMVQVVANGDFNASSSSILPTGETLYISQINSQLIPASGEMFFDSWNNKGYVYLRITNSGQVYVGNYTGNISTRTNGGFMGTYLTN